MSALKAGQSVEAAALTAFSWAASAVLLLAGPLAAQEICGPNGPPSGGICIRRPEVAPPHPLPMVTPEVWASIQEKLEASRSPAKMWRVGEKLTGSLKGLGILDIGNNANALRQLKGLPAPKSRYSDVEHGPPTDTWIWGKAGEDYRGDTLKVVRDVQADRILTIIWQPTSLTAEEFFRLPSGWAAFEVVDREEFAGFYVAAGALRLGPVLRATPTIRRGAYYIESVTIEFAYPGIASND